VNLIKESGSFALSGSNVSCEFEIADNLWQVEADEGQISQVIHNLVLNARHSMPEGGTMRINAKNFILDSYPGSQFEAGIYIKIEIHDQGVGISKEHLKRIFDPYFTTKQTGSGLGLAVSYSIINNHDGHISADSEQGVGTTLTIYLPATEEHIAEEDLLEKGLIAGEGKILLMDDEDVVRNSVGEMLLQIGYEVKYAEEGVAAIEKYKEAMKSSQPFDAVIMDLTVPGGMGGAEAIKKLREIVPNIKAIVSSGYSNNSVMAKFREYGFNDVLSKPYSPEKLSRILDKLLKGPSE
jgi:CheY-like chemotaxis protein